MPDRRMELVFPAAGLDRSAAFQNQPPWTTPDALNVMPYAASSGRRSGGSRPGRICYSLLTLAGGVTPKVNMLGSVRAIPANNWKLWEDTFLGQIDSDSWNQTAGGTPFPSVDAGFAYATDTGLRYDAVRQATPPVLAASGSYGAAMLCAPYMGRWHGNFYLYLRMNDTVPHPYDYGVVLTLHIEDTYLKLIMNRYVGGSVANSSTKEYTTGTVRPNAGWFTAIQERNGAGQPTTLRVYYTGIEDGTNPAALYAGNTGGFDANEGTKVGFGLEVDPALSGGRVQTDAFRYFYEQAGDVEPRDIVVAAANGEVYHETAPGKMEAADTDVWINTDVPISSAQQNGLLYIADHETSQPTTNTGTAEWTGGGDKKILLGSLDAFDTEHYGIRVTNVTSGDALLGNYKVTSISGAPPNRYAYVDPEPSAVQGSGGGAIEFQIVPLCKVYDHNGGALTLDHLTCNVGVYPIFDTIASYRGRLLVNDRENPNWLWASRIGDPRDWDVGDFSLGNGGGGAWANNLGQFFVGQAVRAIAPHGDDFCVLGNRNELWLMLGDMGFGGTIENRSRVVGIRSRFAWCYGPNGEIFFLSDEGLMGMPPGGYPSALSKRRLPEELREWDAQYDEFVAYDPIRDGIWIFISGRDGTRENSQWWLDLNEPGLGYWPQRFGNTGSPGGTRYDVTAALSVPLRSAPDRGVLMGTRDGWLRRFYQHAGLDSSDLNRGFFDSYVNFGPMRLGGDLYSEGQITEMVGVLGETSGPVTVGLRVGTTAEESRAAANDKEVTWSAGRNAPEHPRSRGGAFNLRLQGNTPGRPWSFEGASVDVRSAGKQRAT